MRRIRGIRFSPPCMYGHLIEARHSKGTTVLFFLPFYIYTSFFLFRPHLRERTQLHIGWEAAWVVFQCERIWTIRNGEFDCPHERPLIFGRGKWTFVRVCFYYNACFCRCQMFSREKFVFFRVFWSKIKWGEKNRRQSEISSNISCGKIFTFGKILTRISIFDKMGLATTTTTKRGVFELNRYAFMVGKVNQPFRCTHPYHWHTQYRK